MEDRTFTDQSVWAGIAAGASWADPTTDPTTIDWEARQAAALVPFDVIDGRPVNPTAPTGTRYGRNYLGHWGEQACADALVVTLDPQGHRWILLIERADGHGWATPGGYVDPGEYPTWAAIRELREETGLTLPHDSGFKTLPARIVPDPRASDEAWMVTVPVVLALPWETPRVVEGADDAHRAEWLPADTYATLTAHLAALDGEVYPAHRDMLADLLS